MKNVLTKIKTTATSKKGLVISAIVGTIVLATVAVIKNSAKQQSKINTINQHTKDNKKGI